MPDAVSVLVVDDDPVIREILREYLSEHGYAVSEAADGAAMRAVLAERIPQVVLLDLRLPGEDGLSLARYLRARFDNIGIIMVSGAGETVDRIVGLEVGADDYVTKPFDLRELRARLKSVLSCYRRPPVRTEPAAQMPGRQVAFAQFVLDLDAHRLATTDGEEIPLTTPEFELLKVFAEHPNRPLSRDQLSNLVRNRDWNPDDRSIDIRISRLRRKIEADPGEPRIIRTVRGVGYMFVVPKTA